MKRRILLLVLLLIIMSITGCQILAPEPTPTPTNTPLPTSTPTPEPTATPTPTPTPAPSVFGSLVTYDTDEPLVGAHVILCPVGESGTECTIDTSLTAVTDENGAFDIPVEPGEYALLYTISEAPAPELDGITLDYSEPDAIESMNGVTVFHKLMLSFTHGNSIPGSDVNGCLQQFFSSEGFFISSYAHYIPYDVGIVLYMSKLISVVVEGAPTGINLGVWNLGDEASCEDFNPYR